MRIALDAMGGDYAPGEIVKGAVDAARDLGLHIILVGDKIKVKDELNKYETEQLRLEIVHAPEVIEMGEHPATALRKKRQASIAVATDLVKQGLANAVVSAGSTGAAMAAALLRLGRIKGIERPAIATVMPTKQKGCVVLDVGANIDVKPDHLYQYAMMGNIYAEKILNRQQPRVGLLNIGEEETKGNETVLQAYSLLKQAPINFIGNVEGRDITKGEVDVVVCDGFVGNIVLKFAEGLASTLFGIIKDKLSEDIMAKIGAALILPKLKSIKKMMDYAEYGGAPLLGVEGVCIISHGSSNAYAIKNALRVAAECVQQDVIGQIRKNIAFKAGESDGSC